MSKIYDLIWKKGEYEGKAQSFNFPSLDGRGLRGGGHIFGNMIVCCEKAKILANGTDVIFNN